MHEGAELPRGRWRIPTGATAYKRTPTFTAATVPKGLLRAHDTKAGVWGELVVLAGTVVFVDLGDDADETKAQAETLSAGRHGLIAPRRPHRVEPSADARFFVMFWS